MEQKNRIDSFKKLLDRLQEDSWQLELLISGFAIFGLFYALEPIKHYWINSYVNSNEMAIEFYRIAIISIDILIFNLLFHVLLRALWIGSLGLRSVFGEIEYDKLNYSIRFTKYLKKKVGSFDDYILKLENISSVMFAISFLLIFYVVSYSMIKYLAINIEHLKSIVSIEWISIGIKIFQIVYFTGASLTFIDFLTQGLLKKNKWVSLFYFPFYRVFSILTFSFLYRPLVYNFLDNKLGRRISLMLFPIYFTILMATSLYYQTSNIIPLWNIRNAATKNIASGYNYEDIINNNTDLSIGTFAIQSKIITEPYIKVIIPLRKYLEDDLIEFNPDLKQGEDIRGYHSPIQINVGKIKLNNHKSINIDSLVTVYLNTFQRFYSFKIDSTICKTDFVITQNEKKSGIETYIGIKDLQEGKHFIEFQKLKHKDTDSLVSILKVPFWYYKN